MIHYDIYEITLSNHPWLCRLTFSQNAELTAGVNAQTLRFALLL